MNIKFINLTVLVILSLNLGFCKKKEKKNDCYSDHNLDKCKQYCLQNDRKACSILCLRTSRIANCKKACNLGVNKCCRKLRILYKNKPSEDQKNKIEIPKDNPTAQKIVQINIDCDNEEYSACNRLADYYYQGKYTKQNKGLAISLYKKSCKSGIERACTFLADLYLQGKDVDKDIDKGINYLKNSCKNKHYTACYILGIFYNKGKYLKKDREKSEKLFKLACKMDVQESCFALGSYYLTQNDKKNSKKGYLLLDEACRGGVGDACYTLGILLKSKKNKNIPKNLDPFLQYLDKACSEEVGDSCEVAKKYREKIQDQHKANIKQVVQACRQGDSEACKNAGELFNKGFFVKKNQNKAKTYLKMGCKKGNKTSCKLYQQLK
ncbi:MAG: hypothetical protein PF689_06950 [Deltaproteobacteria bacterium]|nr:hypothetical protein [Deltaproteobacteria bacterium]